MISVSINIDAVEQYKNVVSEVIGMVRRINFANVRPNFFFYRKLYENRISFQF